MADGGNLMAGKRGVVFGVANNSSIAWGITKAIAEQGGKVALTFQGEHHVFQGCPASAGWSHSASSDLVHWTDRGRGVHMLHETYEGMDSTSCGPCSGFVTVDDEGTPCAGFRQCGSTKGATGLNRDRTGTPGPAKRAEHPGIEHDRTG